MEPSKPSTSFDWSLYRDATLAGLSVLIPIPFLDSAFEWFFQRRILWAVAARHNQRLPQDVEREINRDDGSALGCLLWPVTLTWSLVKRLSRKLLYFLTIKEATDRLSYYWHRAFLLDYLLEAGHLADVRSAQAARQALAHTLNTIGTSPLTLLARQIVSRARHVLGSLRRARRGQEDAELQADRSRIARAWAGFAAHLGQVAQRYERAYAQALATRAAQEAEAARRAAELAEMGVAPFGRKEDAEPGKAGPD